jgi:hypothetical protein
MRKRQVKAWATADRNGAVSFDVQNKAAAERVAASLDISFAGDAPHRAVLLTERDPSTAAIVRAAIAWVEYMAPNGGPISVHGMRLESAVERHLKRKQKRKVKHG